MLLISAVLPTMAFESSSGSRFQPSVIIYGPRAAGYMTQCTQVRSTMAPATGGAQLLRKAGMTVYDSDSKGERLFACA